MPAYSVDNSNVNPVNFNSYDVFKKLRIRPTCSYIPVHRRKRRENEH